MMYAAVVCSVCKNNRIANLSSLSSKCPYCNTVADHKNIKIIFKDQDQSVVRDALAHLHESEMPVGKNRPDTDPDPLSTLVHRYERTTNLEDRMEILSEGLTRIFDTFTLEDIEKIDPENAEKMLSVMLDRCMIYEIGYGRYRV